MSTASSPPRISCVSSRLASSARRSWPPRTGSHSRATDAPAGAARSAMPTTTSLESPRSNAALESTACGVGNAVGVP
ncbi:MAG: hypothetical protein ACK55I_30480, partial [bacterium]